MRIQLQAIVLGLALASLAPTVLAQSADTTLGSMTPIPDGYLRVQTPPEWRGMTIDWYQAQAFNALIGMQSAASTTFAGVGLVDRDTGEILATFTSDQLQSPTQ